MSYIYNVPGFQFENAAEARNFLRIMKGESVATTETFLQADELAGRCGLLYIKSPFSPSELLEKNLAGYHWTTVETETPEEQHTTRVQELQKKLEEAAAIALEIKDYTVLSSISNVLSIL